MVGGDLRCAWPAECGAAVGVFHGFQNSCCILVGSLLTARSIRLRALSSRGGWRHNTYLAGVRGGVKMSIIPITPWVVLGPDDDLLEGLEVFVTV